jgi:hypothetical protein
LISKQQILDAAWVALLEENTALNDVEDIVPEGFLSVLDFAKLKNVGEDTAEKFLRKLYLDGKLEKDKFRRRIRGGKISKITHYKPKS